jgi:hypothetical protein
VISEREYLKNYFYNLAKSKNKDVWMPTIKLEKLKLII